MITSFVLLDAEPEQIAELVPMLAEIHGVSEAHSVAGTEADLVAVVRVPAHDDLARVVTEHIAKLPGVKATRTMIAFRSYSGDQLDAGYEGFGD